MGIPPRDMGVSPRDMGVSQRPLGSLLETRVFSGKGDPSQGHGGPSQTIEVSPKNGALPCRSGSHGGHQDPSWEPKFLPETRSFPGDGGSGITLVGRGGCPNLPGPRRRSRTSRPRAPLSCGAGGSRGGSRGRSRRTAAGARRRPLAGKPGRSGGARGGLRAAPGMGSEPPGPPPVRPRLSPLCSRTSPRRWISPAGRCTGTPGPRCGTAPASAATSAPAA